MATKTPNAKKDDVQEISILEVEKGRIEVCVLGTTPLLTHCMAEKSGRELLMPTGRLNAAEKSARLKHNPPEEYRAAAYTIASDDAPTRLGAPAGAFKSAMCSAAVDIPGAAKAQFGRLTTVESQFGELVAIFGVPKLHMEVVRLSDMNRTPDIRTRPILPSWACRLSITYVRPILREQTVIRLLAAAGIMRGIGEGRPERAGSNGQFELVSENDKRWQQIVKTGGRKAQDAALLDPECYDEKAAKMYAWFLEEVTRRGYKVVA